MKDNKNKIILEFNSSDINSRPAIDYSVSFRQTINDRDVKIANQINMLNSLSNKVKGTDSYSNIIRSITLSDIDIEKLTILRIFENTISEYNIYITFIINGSEYWGVINNILSPNPELKCELFKKDNKPNEWNIRIKGKIINFVLNWLIPEKGEYETLVDYNCYSKMSGQYVKIKKGSIINVKRTYANEIFIEYNDETYIIKSRFFIYFNYWTKKID